MRMKRTTPVDTGSTVPKSYAEVNKDGAPNTDAVASYSAEDPEGLSVSWDLRGTDAALFTIIGGELRFVSPPDYEDPKDSERAATDLNVDGDTDDFGEAVSDEEQNTYNVIVRAIAGRASGDSSPAQTSSFGVDVTVTNVEEPGTIVLSRLQPEAEGTNTDDQYTDASRAIRATLTDPDGDAGERHVDVACLYGYFE